MVSKTHYGAVEQQYGSSFDEVKLHKTANSPVLLDCTRVRLVGTVLGLSLPYKSLDCWTGSPYPDAGAITTRARWFLLNSKGTIPHGVKDRVYHKQRYPHDTHRKLVRCGNKSVKVA